MMIVEEMAMSRYRLASVLAVCAVLSIVSVSVTVSFQDPASNPPANEEPAPKLAIDQTWESPPGQIVDRSATSQLARVIGMLRQNNPNTDYVTILRQLQRILVDEEDAFITSDSLPIEQQNPLYSQRANVSLRSIKSVVEQIINELPQNGRKTYERLYGVEAAAIAETALSNNDHTGLKQIARERFHTTAGYEAAYMLGDRRLEQSSPVTALRHLERLRGTVQRKNLEPLLSIKIAGAWLQLGRTDKAIQTLDDFLLFAKKYPASQRAFNKLVDAKSKNVDDLLQQISLMIPANSAASSPTPDWLHYMGDVTRSAEPIAFNPVGDPLWSSSTLGYADEPTEKQLLLFKFDPAKGKVHVPESDLEMAAAIRVGLDKLAERELRKFQPSIPATYPLIAGNIAVFRTLNRVRAVNVTTGELEWETFTEDESFEEQFDVGSIKTVNSRIPNNDITSPMNRYQDSFLTARTRTDRTTGTLSCDGELVYYVEGCGIPDQSLNSSQIRFGRSRIESYNRLLAVELESGLLRWEIGGPRNEFAVQSAGRFFLGPPTPVGDELFVLVEEDAAVRLIALDRLTGAEVWAQSISQPHAGVSYEALRRVAGDMPTFIDGLLICPTSAGQIVAFDVSQRRFVWSFQYDSQLRAISKNRRRVFRGAYVSTTRLALGTRWSDNAVVSSGGRLLVTPLDAESLYCLDVQSGKELWRKARQNGSYLATVADGAVIVVESTGVRSLSVKDGEQNWFVPLENRRVSGRGLRTGSLFHLPIAVKADLFTVAARDEDTGDKTGPPSIKVPEEPNAKKEPGAKPEKEPTPQGDKKDSETNKKPTPQPTYRHALRGGILTIDLRKGIVLAESGFPAGVGIGNLAASNGTLISQSFDAVVALESLDSITKRVEESLAKNPQDGKFLALRGQLAFHQGDVDVGLETLTRAVTLGAGQRAQDALLRAILERLRFGGDLPEDAIKLLEKSATGRLKFTVQRIRAESFVRTGQFKVAFETLLDLAQNDALKNPNFEQQLESVTLSGNRWIGGRLRDVYESAKSKDESAVAEIDKLVAAELEQVFKTNQLSEFNHWLEKYQWHPHSIKMRERLIENYDATTDFVRIERHLAASIQLSGDSDRASRQAKLLKQWMAMKSKRGVANSIDAFIATAADQKFEDGKSAVDLANEWKNDKDIAALRTKPTWKTVPAVMHVDEVATPRLRVLMNMVEPRSPVLRGLRLETDTQGKKLRAINEQGIQDWEIDVTRLPSPQTKRVQSVSYSQKPRVFSDGHLMVLVLGSATTGVDFYVFDNSGKSPVMIWSRMLAKVGGSSSANVRQVFNGRIVIGTSTGSRSFFSVDALTNETIIYRDGNTLTVVDALTGDTLWERANVATNSKIIADENHIAILSPTNTDHNILSLYDGHLVKTTRLPTNVYLANNGMRVMFWVTNSSGARSLAAYDALTGETLWRHSYDSTARYRTLNDTRLIAVGDVSGQIQIRNIDDGKLLLKAQGEELELLTSVVAWSGLDHYVVFMTIPQTDRRKAAYAFQNVGIVQNQVHGLVYGINKESGKIDWTRDLPNTLFQTHQPSHVPFFVLAHYSRQFDPLTRETTLSGEVRIIDSRTGDTVFEHIEPSRMRQYQTFSNPEKNSAKVVCDRFVVELNYDK
jgi:outer membrane protein assembly factor BamB